LPGGKKITGANELRKLLKSRKEDFVRCLSEKLLTYALGRGLDYYDEPAIDKICEALPKGDYRFSALLTEIVKSTPFQLRRGANSRENTTAQK